MKIGMVCYASHGGSGIVATELGGELAARGHEVHFITNDVPVRMDRYRENLFFHRVEVDNYPVFAYTPYSLNLAAKILDVIRAHGLDIIHAHYAVPHATSAYLAKQMCQPCGVRTVTTLHGTDITLVGVKPSFFEITRFSIEQSDRVTAVSTWLRDQTTDNFGDVADIAVIPNFVDSEQFRPFTGKRERSPWCGKGEFVMMHASNFRPVKNVPRVLDVFERLHGRYPVTLLFVGDGPELPAAQERVRASGWEDSVHFLGSQEYLEDILPLADVFLLPSEHESFGLAALEAMASNVIVVATNAGGTREVIRHGENGFLHDPHDVDGMSASVQSLLDAPETMTPMQAAARKTAVEEFPVGAAVDQYVKVYEEALAK